MGQVHLLAAISENFTERQSRMKKMTRKLAVEQLNIHGKLSVPFLQRKFGLSAEKARQILRSMDDSGKDIVEKHPFNYT